MCTCFMRLRILLLSVNVVHYHAKVQKVVIRRHDYRERYGTGGTQCVGTSAIDNDTIPIRRCEDGARTQFIIFDGAFSTIQPAHHPDVCLEASESPVLLSFSPVRFRPCSGLSNQSFTLPKRSKFHKYTFGHICLASKPDSCLFTGLIAQLNGPVFLTFSDSLYKDMNLYWTLGITNDAMVKDEWSVFTGSSNMWFGSRVTEAHIFRILFYYMVLFVVAYIIYIIKTYYWLLGTIRSLGIAAACLQVHTRTRAICRRILEAFGNMRSNGATSDEVTSLRKSIRMQRAKAYLPRVLHAFALYAVFKAHQLWNDVDWGMLCSNDGGACAATKVRAIIYSYEFFPLFVMVGPGVFLCAWLGGTLKPWACDMLIAISFVGWSLQYVYKIQDKHGMHFGLEYFKMIMCRLVQVFVLGNPSLASCFNVLAYIVDRAYAYRICYGPYRGSDEGPCGSYQNVFQLLFESDTATELGSLLVAASLLHIADTLYSRQTITRRKENANAVAVIMLQKHLDVLYDCVVHLSASFDVATGTPKLAGLLLRGAVNTHSLKGRYLPDLIGESDRQRFIEHMDVVSRSDHVGVLHISFVDGNGGLVPCELYASSAIDSAGTPTYILGVRETVMAEHVREGSNCDRVRGLTNFTPQECLTEREIGSASLGGDNAIELESCPSSSSLSVPQNLWLEVLLGDGIDLVITSCSFDLQLVLGEVAVGSCLNHKIYNKGDFKYWFPTAINLILNEQLPPRFQAILEGSRWRRKISTILEIESSDLYNARIALDRVKYYTAPAVSKKRRRQRLRMML